MKLPNASFNRFVFRPLIALAAVSPLIADPFFFSTGNPDGKMASASRPSSAGKIEIESADDFVLTQNVSLTQATFTGLIPTQSTLGSIKNVVVEIYRVFPNDSDISRTSGAPTFSTPGVPTRVNSPSDVAFDSRDASANNLTFTPSVVSGSFTVLNTVLNGIHPKPGQTTGGDGSVTGQEVSFNIQFTTPLDLPADHYFFIPQVELDNGDFYWLSAPKPIVPPATPFPPGATDLQSWIRNENLDPDWLRIGTDIVGGQPAPTFNAAFSLTGVLQNVPDTGTTVELTGLAVFLLARIRRQNPV